MVEICVGLAHAHALRQSTLACTVAPPEAAHLLAALDALTEGGEEAAREEPVDPAGAAIGRIRARFLASLPVLPRGRIGASAVSGAITSSMDQVQRAEGLVLELRRAGSAVELTLPGMGTVDEAGLIPRTLREPFFMEEALTFVVRAETPFRVCDLPVSVSDETKLVLARRWLEAGLLERPLP